LNYTRMYCCRNKIHSIIYIFRRKADAL